MGVGKRSFQRGMRHIIFLCWTKKSSDKFFYIRVLGVEKYEQATYCTVKAYRTMHGLAAKT